MPELPELMLELICIPFPILTEEYGDLCNAVPEDQSVRLIS